MGRGTLRFLAHKGFHSGLIGLLSLSLIWLECSAGEGSIEALLQRGEQERASGNAEAALGWWSEARQLAPSDIRPYLKTARLLADSNRLHDARMELQEASNLEVAAPQLEEYVRLLIQSGRSDEAFQVLTRSSKPGHLSPAALWILSELYLERRNVEAALTTLEQASLGREDDASWMARGRILIQAGRLEEALTAFERVVALDPENAEGYFQIATVMRMGNNPPAAERMARRALELAPDVAGYWHLLALASISQGKKQEGLDQLQRAASQSDVFARIYFDLGNLYRELGQTRESREALLHYRDLNEAAEQKKNLSQRQVQLVNQGELALQRGEPGVARDAFVRALENDPEDWDSHLFLSKLYLSSPRPDLAWPHLQKLRTLEPLCSEVSFLLAFYWNEKGDPVRALEAAQRGRRERPGYPELRNLLGNLYLARGSTEQALIEYETASRLAPDNMAFRANYQSIKKGNSGQR